MLKADYLLRLMKQRTDALVATDEKLQQFLMWVNEKSLSVDLPYKLAAVRAFYFALDVSRTLDPALNPTLDPVLDRALDRTLDPAFVCVLDLILDAVLARVLALDYVLAPILIPTLDYVLAPTLIPALDSALDPAIDLALSPELRQALQELKAQLPDPDSGEKIFKLWWHIHSQAWIRQLRTLMIKHRNMGHDWHFSLQHKEVLKQYYDANKLLVDCLNSSSDVTPAVRSHIEETLLLPIAEIKKHR